MKHPVFGIFIILMLAGNLLALYKLWTDKASFLSSFPELNETAFTIFRIIPLLNIIALTGLWFFKPWAVWASVILAAGVIFFDSWYKIRYHLPIAIASTLLLLFFIYRYRSAFE